MLVNRVWQFTWLIVFLLPGVMNAQDFGAPPTPGDLLPPAPTAPGAGVPIPIPSPPTEIAPPNVPSGSPIPPPPTLPGGGTVVPPINIPGDAPPPAPGAPVSGPGLAHPLSGQGNPTSFSRWTTGACPDCCGPLVGNPMRSELYLRVGPTWTVGSGTLDNALDNGWKIEGGARLLFFNEVGSAAWTLDMGLGTATNYGAKNQQSITLLNVPNSAAILGGPATVPQFGVTVKRYNRTYVQLGGGREWYLRGNALQQSDCGGNCGWDFWNGPWTWRAGVDAGGRWGASKIEFFELQHKDDVIGAFYFAGHTDVEIPCGACIFYVGLRLEYNRSYSDILQTQNNSDVSDINLLFSGGIRY